MSYWCPIVELRRYTLHPHRRDELIELFDTRLVEPQEAVGMVVMGQFRDLDAPDAFVWLRGFRDMESRRIALTAFYDGPVWRTHRDAANATMVDSDDVLLLRPAWPGSGFAPALRDGSVATGETLRGLVAATIYPLTRSPDATFLDFFQNDLAPHLRAAGASLDAAYASETSANTFPRLPIREDGEVLIWFSAFEGPQDHQRFLARLSASVRWKSTERRLARFLREPPSIQRLTPTARSRLPPHPTRRQSSDPREETHGSPS